MLTDALAALLPDSERLSALSQAGHEGVHRYFDIFTHARELISVYESDK
jgi:hypothetical protein